jgi:hypothetical protein
MRGGGLIVCMERSWLILRMSHTSGIVVCVVIGVFVVKRLDICGGLRFADSVEGYRSRLKCESSTQIYSGQVQTPVS